MKNDDLKEIYSIVKRQIENFDFKAEIFITISGVWLGVLLSGNIFSDFFNNTASFIFLAISILLLVTSLLFFIFSILPRSKKNEKSFLYYKDISKMDETYFQRISDEELKDEYTKQLLIVSKICYRKHVLLKIGIIIFSIAVVVSIISIFLSLLI